MLHVEESKLLRVTSVLRVLENMPFRSTCRKNCSQARIASFLFHSHVALVSFIMS